MRICSLHLHEDEPIRYQGQRKTPVHMSKLPPARRAHIPFLPKTEDCVSLAELKHKSSTKQTCTKLRTDHVTEEKRAEQTIRQSGAI